MEQYVICGGSPLVGEVEIGGAKNAALAILAAAIMADEPVVIENIPDTRDINTMLRAVEGLGATVKRFGPHRVSVNGATVGIYGSSDDYMKTLRGSYYLLGALLGKYKKAEVALPGGCNIGSRPIDQHMKGFRALGAEVHVEHGNVVANAKTLRGSHIYLDVVSVGATINVMMAAALAEGSTIIENSAKEPHVVDVANFLNSMGANIKGAGTDVIRVKGVDSLHKAEYSIIPDQIEAGTFMFAAAATRGDVIVKNVIPKHLEATTAKLLEIGCEIEERDDSIRVVASKQLLHTRIKTLPYPGFPTDMQPQMTVVLALSEGTSTVTENIFENRFKYVDELSRMGADITVEGNTAIINGISKYTGAHVSALDLRAGAALVIAGLAAEGYTVVDDIHYVERGYECFDEKLRNLGARIEKVSSEREIQKFKLKIG
jgi:UDP-N-acetylglucosamine 1-carboxyvinyltransferase